MLNESERADAGQRHYIALEMMAAVPGQASSMNEWRTTAIRELADGGERGVAGGPFGSALGRKDYVADGVPVIRGAQLAGQRRFSSEDLVFVSSEKADRHSGNLAYPGDVVVTQRGTLGQVGLIPTSSPHKRFLLSQSQMKISVERSAADPEFVYFALRSPAVRRGLIDHAMTAGVPHINLATLREFEIAIPGLDTQGRIAAVLSAFDELIEVNERRVELLEDLVRSLYHEWCVSFRFPGHGDGQLVDSELGLIPEGWEARRLGEVAVLNCETLTVGDLPDPLLYLDISSVGVGRLGEPSVVEAAEAPGRARRRLRHGDVVWATVRPNRRAHGLVHDPPTNLIASTGLAVLTAETVPSSYLFSVVADPAFTEYLVGRANRIRLSGGEAERFRGSAAARAERCGTCLLR